MTSPHETQYMHHRVLTPPHEASNADAKILDASSWYKTDASVTLTHLFLNVIILDFFFKFIILKLILKMLIIFLKFF